jgi:nitrate reductase NapE component
MNFDEQNEKKEIVIMIDQARIERATYFFSDIESPKMKVEQTRTFRYWTFFLFPINSVGLV